MWGRWNGVHVHGSTFKAFKPFCSAWLPTLCQQPLIVGAPKCEMIVVKSSYNVDMKKSIISYHYWLLPLAKKSKSEEVFFGRVARMADSGHGMEVFTPLWHPQLGQLWLQIFFCLTQFHLVDMLPNDLYLTASMLNFLTACLSLQEFCVSILKGIIYASNTSWFHWTPIRSPGHFQSS